ncbi:MULTISPECIES: hypothetical protein [Sphingomonas]|jgi:hypothetical protein|uniref:hypothetical protein n=1 Tax=Sphingomonas TaxID=13687 RepID=UPI00254CB024|nr:MULTISPECIES: hypothetical protein [Sphingomonas]MDK8188431.1 hypothetical protein [Sphingomonas zeae]MDK8216348.1 hypothetical protein [Sphingomonas sp. UMB7805-LC452B]
MTDPTEIARVAAGLTRAEVEILTGPSGQIEMDRDAICGLLLKGMYQLVMMPEGRAVRDHILREKSGG